MGLKDIVTVAVHVLLTFLKKDKVENALWVFFPFLIIKKELASVKMLLLYIRYLHAVTVEMKPVPFFPLSLH